MKNKLLSTGSISIIFLGALLPQSSALEYDIRYASARNALVSQEWSAAKQHFTRIVENDPAADKAHFMLAFLNLVLLLENPQVEAFFDTLDLNLEGPVGWSDLADITLEDVPADVNISQLAELLKEAVLPALSAAAEHLNRIQSNDFHLQLRPEYFGIQGYIDTLVADRIDTHMLHAMAKAAQAVLRWTVQSHSLELTWESISGVIEWNYPTTLESILQDNPAFLHATDTASRQQAQAELFHAISLYVNHAQWLRDPQRRFERLFYLLEEELESEAAFRAQLLDIYAAMEGPIRSDSLHNERFESLQHIDLRPLFTNLDLRTALLNNAVGNRLMLPADFDATIAGLFPNAKLTELEGFLSDAGALEQRPLGMGQTDLANFSLEWETSEQSRWWMTADRRATAGQPLSYNTDSWLKTRIQGPALLSWNLSGPGWYPTGYLDLKVNSKVRWSEYVYSDAEQITLRLGAGEQSVAWHFFPEWYADPVGGAAHVSDVTVEMRNHFAITTPEGTTRTELRGMTPDGSVLIGTLWEGDWPYPAYDPGDGHFRRLGNSSSNMSNDGIRFATASDVSADGKLIAGRSRNWEGYEVATLWEMRYGYPWDITLEWNHSAAVGIGGHLNQVVVGRRWTGQTWEAVVWRQTADDPWSWRQTESFSHPLAYEADWHSSWLYSISADGRTAVGFSELQYRLESPDTEDQWLVRYVPLIWREDEGFTELPYPPVPDNTTGLNGAQANYIAKNAAFIVGDFRTTDQSGNATRSVIFWRYQGGGWHYELIHAPDWLTHVGVTPLPRITEDGVRIYTSGSRVSDEGVEFEAIVWTRATGWQPAADLHRTWLQNAHLQQATDFLINPNASVIAVTDAEDTNIHILYAPHTADTDSTHFHGSGWMHNDWMQLHFPIGEFLFSPDNGWLRAWPAPAGGLFVYHLQHKTWGWTHANLFPWVYGFDSQSTWTRWN